jgi:hypothetical protein
MLWSFFAALIQILKFSVIYMREITDFPFRARYDGTMMKL